VKRAIGGLAATEVAPRGPRAASEIEGLAAEVLAAIDADVCPSGSAGTRTAQRGARG
jgi:hypothetical protein